MTDILIGLAVVPVTTIVLALLFVFLAGPDENPQPRSPLFVEDRNDITTPISVRRP